MLDITQITTPPGIIAVSAFVTTLIQLLKNVFPAIDARFSGALQAFILTAVVYVIGDIAMAPTVIQEHLDVIFAWVTCATATVGIYSAGKHWIEEAQVNRKKPRRKVIKRDEKFDDD